MQNDPADTGSEPPLTLGLGGDLDDVELLMDIEQTFNVSFSDEEYEDLITVGDIYRLLLKHLPPAAERGEKCATSMCFYRLRRVLQPLAPHVPLRPDTPISAFGDRKPEDILDPVRTQAGLRAPNTVLTPIGDICVSVMFLSWLAALIGGLFFGLPWWSILVLVFVPPTVLYFMPRRIPPKIDTFGALVRKTAALNIGSLAGSGARLSDADVWNALVEVIANFDMIERDTIRPETLLLA